MGMKPWKRLEFKCTGRLLMRGALLRYIARLEKEREHAVRVLACLGDENEA